MLDLKYIRENAEAVQENSRTRGVEADVGLVVELADRRSALIQELNELRQRQNQMARSIGKEQDPESRDRLIAESRAMKDRIPEKEADLSEVELRMREELLKIPNMTHPDAPIARTTQRTSRSGAGERFPTSTSTSGITSSSASLWAS